MNLSILQLTILTVFVSVYANGCATTHQTIPRPNESATPSDLATVYLERVGVLGSGNSFVVYDNRKYIGKLGPGGTLLWQRQPGTMFVDVTVKGLGFTVDERGIYVETEGGKTYSYRLAYDGRGLLVKPIERITEN